MPRRFSLNAELPSDQRSPGAWFNVSAFQMNARGTANRIPTPGGGAFGTINETRATVPMRQLQFAVKVGF